MAEENQIGRSYLPIIFIGLLLFSSLLQADLYYYKEENGTLHFTNSPDLSKNYKRFNRTIFPSSEPPIRVLKVHPFQVKIDRHNNNKNLTFNPVNSVCFNPNGKYIASGNDDNTINLWRVKDGVLLTTFEGHSGYVRTVSFSPDGKHIASGSSDNTIKLWNVKDGDLLKTTKEHSDDIAAICFSPDSKHILYASFNDEINLWNIRDGSLINTLKNRITWVRAVSFSPNGRLVVSDSYDNAIKLWSSNDGKLIRAFNGHSDHVFSVKFSPDSRFIASGSRDSLIKLWDVEDGKLLKSFKGHSGDVYSVSFSPDGSHIASGSNDKTIKLWNVNSGKLIRNFKGHSGDIYSVSFSPDGNRIVSGSFDSSLRTWNINDENDYSVYVSLPDNEWISFKSGQPYYNSSPNGDTYASIIIDINNTKYEPLRKFRNQYKRTDFFKPITAMNDSREVQVKLLCTYEGKKVNACYIDEEIKVYTNCLNKYSPLKYNETLQMFTGHAECRDFNVHSSKFQNQLSYSFAQKIVEMKFTKPILYVLINPSIELKTGPLSRYYKNFDIFKKELRLLSSMLDNNQKYRFWSDRWLKTYFFTKHAEHESVLLCNAGIFATKWDDPNFINDFNKRIYFKNHSISFGELIDDACIFFDGFSISDDLKIKGAALIIIATPQSPIPGNELIRLDQKLHQNNYCALIVQFGENEKETIFKGKYKKLKLMEINLENEFYNGFFKGAFEKIISEFEFLIDTPDQ